MKEWTITADTVSVPREVIEEAIGWRVAQADGLAPGEEAAFAAWLDCDPLHRRAWQRLDRSLGSFRTVQECHISGRAIADSFEQQQINRRQALKSVCAATGAVGATLSLVDRFVPLGGLTADFSTRTGERRSWNLAGGGRLTLDARSEANIRRRSGGTRIDLHSGALRLIVPAGGAQVEAASGEAVAAIRAGEIVMSRRLGEQCIICRRGTATFAAPWTNASQIPSVGGLAYDGVKARTLSEREAEDAASWLDGKLILRDRPLGELIDRFRPYKAGVIALTAAAADLHISGVFNLDDLSATLESIQSILPVSVMRIGDLFLRIDVAIPN